MLNPSTEAELAEAIRSAKTPLNIVGGNTRQYGGERKGELLSMSNMSGIELYEPGALTLVAKAGTSLSEIKKTLASENQRLAFEPMDHQGLLGTQGTSTIGGVAAANISGPRRIQAGACRDFMLGVRLVDGNGAVLKNGGRVMKNVTGYDLVKLMAGSFGTLGVISEISFKVLPDVETSAVMLINDLSDQEAIKAMSEALGSPFEVTGAAHTPKGIDGHPVTMIRIEGFEKSVAYRTNQLISLLGKFGESHAETNPLNIQKGWEWVRDVKAFDGLEGDIWRISMKPSDAPSLVAGLDSTAVQYDWGGGLLWVLMPTGIDLRAKMKDVNGHATLLRKQTQNSIPIFQPETNVIAQIGAGIRAKMDPRNILNVGLMG